MATHSSVLAWRIPGTGEPGVLLSRGCTESDITEATEQQEQNAFGSPRMNSSFTPHLKTLKKKWGGWEANRLPWFNILKIKLLRDSVRKLILR